MKHWSFKPGAIWPDNGGTHINAHGPGFIQVDGVYYWFGEKRDNCEARGVNVYNSTDLCNWTYQGVALGVVDGDLDHDLARGCVIERPKVLFNQKTGKYVLWFHLELRGRGYGSALVAVAVADQVTGPFQYLHSFRPNGHESRDMTLFQDADGQAWLIYASRHNYDLRAAELTEDYLRVTERDELLFAQHREAPALFRHGGYIYMITSAATGWRPNPCRLHRATSIWGPWEHLGNPFTGGGAGTSYDSQSSHVISVHGAKDRFIYVGDRWRPGDLRNSCYVWLPIRFNEENIPYIPWHDQWDLSIFD